MTTKPGESGAAEVVSAADDEFDKAWDEIDAEDAAAATAEAATEDEADEDSDPTSDDLDPSAAEESDEPPAPKADGKTEAQTDIWAGASPEIIAERDRLLAIAHRQRSDEGRIATFQKQITAAQRELAALKAAKPEVPEEDAEALRAAQEEYPEVVKPLLTRIDRQQAVLDEIQQTERSRQELAAADRTARVAAETAQVEAKMPDYLSLISIETYDVDEEGRAIKVRRPSPEFVAWYHAQPADVKAKVDRNADDITNAGETIEVLGAFKTFRDRFHAAATAGDTPQRDTRRQRQIDSSRAVTRGSQQSGLTSAAPNDWDGAWDFYDRQDSAKASRAEAKG